MCMRRNVIVKLFVYCVYVCSMFIISLYSHVDAKTKII